MFDTYKNHRSFKEINDLVKKNAFYTYILSVDDIMYKFLTDLEADVPSNTG